MTEEGDKLAAMLVFTLLLTKYIKILIMISVKEVHANAFLQWPSNVLIMSLWC